MQFPLTMNFKIFAIAPQIFVRDASGNEVIYVKQKLFKLKEAINVFSDQSQSNQLYSIKADRVIDFSARYNFSDHQDMALGAVKRQGMRSLWKASYDVLKGEEIVYQIKEENGFVKLLDGLFGEIPLIGILSGYVFNPVYLINTPGEMGQTVARIAKQPAFMESSFSIEKTDSNLSEQEDSLIVLSALTTILLERSRG